MRHYRHGAHTKTDLEAHVVWIPKYRKKVLAVVQAAPIVFDRDATIEKTARLAADPSEKGAELILFPEAFVPAYPRGLSFGMVVGSRSPEGRRTWQRYWENAVLVPSASTERLGEIAKDAGALLAIGVIERDPSGTLYCTLLYFGADGTLLGKHRKLKPTAAERLIWGEGDGSTLTVLDTELGRVGRTYLLGELHAALQNLIKSDQAPVPASQRIVSPQRALGPERSSPQASVPVKLTVHKRFFAALKSRSFVSPHAAH